MAGHPGVRTYCLQQICKVIVHIGCYSANRIHHRCQPTGHIMIVVCADIQTTQVPGTIQQPFQHIIAICRYAPLAVGLLVQEPVRCIVCVYLLILLTADIWPVVGIKCPGQCLSENPGTVIDVLAGTVALTIQKIVNAIAQTIADPDQTTRGIVAKYHRDGIRRSVRAGNTFHLTRCQIAPAGYLNTGWTAISHSLQTI